MVQCVGFDSPQPTNPRVIAPWGFVMPKKSRTGEGGTRKGGREFFNER